jgi:pimeloyl-ACP methyl ester carboxylesterase
LNAYSDFDTISLATSRRGTETPRALLIHGIGDGGFAWDAFTSHAGPHFAAMTLDLRGHGDSGWDPLQCYGTDVLAADVLRLIDALDLKDLGVIGHSLGAEVATRVAAARPERTRALVLVEGGPELERGNASLMMRQMQSTPRRYDAVAEFQAVLAARYPLADPAALQHYAARALRPGRDGRMELKMDPAFPLGMQLMDAASYWAELSAVSCPMLLVCGQVSSVLSHHNAERLPRRLRNCRLATVAHAGHAVPLENPAGLYDVIGPWLANLG